MTAPVVLDAEGPIAVVTIDNPPVNALSYGVRAGLDEALERAAADPAIRGVVIACKGRTFVAGADISEFGKPLRDPSLRDLVARLDAMEKPVVAALHGTALGGGLELALACHWRVIGPAGTVGLPEILLGLVPGAGGTQRLPRLVGLKASLDIVLSGRRVGAPEALALGLVDAVAPSDLTDFAVRFLTERLDRPLRRVGALPAAAVDPDALSAAKAGAARRMPGQPAAPAAIALVEAAATLPFAVGLDLEAETFGRLRLSEESLALRHVFFAEREAARFPEAAAPRPLGRIAVIGGGTMGAGIAAAALLAGFPVRLVERGEAQAQAGDARVRAILEESRKRGKLSAESLAALRFEASADMAAIGDADLVIEAAFEDAAVKAEIFAAIGRLARDGAVLATNTSYLDVEAIAAASGRPGCVIGLHFFSPAHVMKLLEIVVPPSASPEAVATGLAFARRLGKTAVRAGNADGFIGNRILSAYRKAADYAAEDGASPFAIDAAMRRFGFPMGVYEMQDLAGLDIGHAARRRLDATRDPGERYVAVSDRLVEAGHLGRKTGRGYYIHGEGAPRPNPDVETLLAEEQARKGIAPRAFSPEEIEARLLAAMVNGAAKVLDEGIATRPGDVDVVMISGYGFPRHKGGPLHWAGRQGFAAILRTLDRLSAEDAVFWRAAPALRRWVEDVRAPD